jgi:hypothetical protein
MIARLKGLLFNLLPESRKQRIWLQKVGEEELTFNYSFGFRPTFIVGKGNKSWTRRATTPDGHEPGVVKWFFDNKSLWNNVYDVGASFGFFSAILPQINPDVKLHSFEPSVYFRAWLYSNLRKRNADKWSVVPRFAGEKNTNDTVTLDTYSTGAGAPDVVKMDVDGAETLVLKGSSSLLANGKTIWLIEVHPTDLPKFGSSTEEFLKMVTKDLKVKYLFDLRTQISAWEDKSRPGIQDDFFVCLYPAELESRIRW